MAGQQLRVQVLLTAGTYMQLHGQQVEFQTVTGSL
jgi:hypothetical protein